ncbi:MAG: hypothetical protein JSS07_05750 [Proteobacteria bacterium]|nr:hypothetical protein [Pseudomonadota bacterium]
MKKIGTATAICLALGSSSAFAIGLEGFQINGFLSVAMAWSNEEYLASGLEPVYYTYIRKRPSFDEDSDVGIQITKQIREDTSITTQFLALAAEEWDVEAVWAFLKWEPNDHWQFRVGRVRTNAYMLSEYVNVGYAYPWVRPPEEVYSQVPTDFSNFTGVDLLFKTVFNKRDLSFSVFYGATSGHLYSPSNLQLPFGIDTTIFDTLRTRLSDLYAFNLKYGDEVFSVRAGYQTARLTLDPNPGTALEAVNAILNTMASGVPLAGIAPIGLDYVNYFTTDNVRASFGGIGYQFDWKNFVSMGELVQRRIATPLISNAIGWYLMGGYHVRQFLPHITFARERLVDNKIRRFNGAINSGFMTLSGSPITLDQIASQLVNTSPNFQGGAGSQSSVTLGIRWDVYEGIALKGEYKHIHPDLNSPGLFDYAPIGSVNVYTFALAAVM